VFVSFDKLRTNGKSKITRNELKKLSPFVLSLLYPMFRSSSHGDPGEENRSWGLK